MKVNKLLVLLLAICCIIMVGCKKENGNSNGNNNESYPQAPKIVSTQETIYNDGVESWIVVEASFEDESKMYFVLTSPNTAAVVDRHIFYGQDSNEGYIYRGDVVIPSEIKHLGVVYSITETLGSNKFPTFGRSNALRLVVCPNTMTRISAWTFCGCKGLSSVILSESLKEIGEYAFADSGLVSINIPNTVVTVDTYDEVHPYYPLYALSMAFEGCNDLSYVTIGSSVTKLFGTFNGCSKLTRVTCLADNPPIISSLSGISCLPDGLEIIYVSNQSVEAYKTADGWSQYADIIVGI